MANKVAFNGYCFQSNYFFRDNVGNILYQVVAPQLCTDGTHVPFSGPSKRRAYWNFQIPPELLARVNDVVISHGPGSKDPVELLKASIGKATSILKF